MSKAPSWPLGNLGTLSPSDFFLKIMFKYFLIGTFEHAVHTLLHTLFFYIFARMHRLYFSEGGKSVVCQSCANCLLSKETKLLWNRDYWDKQGLRKSKLALCLNI